MRRAVWRNLGNSGEGPSVELNGSKQTIASRPGTWATVMRKWNPGDVVKATIPMRPRLIPIDKQHPNQVAVVVGSVVLVRENESRIVAREPNPSKWLLSSGEALEYRAPCTSIFRLIAPIPTATSTYSGKIRWP